QGRQSWRQQLFPELDRLDRLAQSADAAAEQRKPPGNASDELACRGTRRELPVHECQRWLRLHDPTRKRQLDHEHGSAEWHVQRLYLPKRRRQLAHFLQWLLG